MTLYEYLELTDGDEVTVLDKDYDVEVYFYFKDPDGVTTDVWDKAMMSMARLMTVKRISNRGVTVNMAEVIENSLDKTDDLFVNNDIDSVMDDIENILAGNVSEKWLVKFVEALSE